MIRLDPVAKVPTLYVLCILAASHVLLSCVGINTSRDETAPYRLSLWGQVPQLSTESVPPCEGPLAVYGTELLEHLRLTCHRDEPIQYRLGWIPFREEKPRSADLQIFVQVLYLEGWQPRGTVFLFHGYANDSSHMTGLAGALLERNWAVVLVDLPGHGLSTGVRGDVVTFFDYGDTVQIVLDWVLSEFDDTLPPPFMAFGHSTGALALIDYSLRYRNRFSRFVFYAPLVRTVWWNTARLGSTLAGPFVKTLRAFSVSPLGLRVFPVHWFNELVAWESWARKKDSIPLPPTRIIQPEQDDVVDSGYNFRFLRDRAPELELLSIEGLSHYATDARIPDSRLLEAVVSYFE